MSQPSEHVRRPSVGLAVLVFNEGKVLLGKRKNAHGAGLWATPGGHLEWNESFEECALRELEEETGSKGKGVQVVSVSNNVMKEDDNHCVAVLVQVEEFEGTLEVREPDKCEFWEWIEWDLLPLNLFFSLRNLVDSGFHPGEDALSSEQRLVVRKAAAFIREQFENEGSGHDWWHIHHVWRNARAIAKREGGDLFVVELAALLHDIADHKFHGGDTNVGAEAARSWLLEHGVESVALEKVVDIVRTISFKEGKNPPMQTIEGQIVQDADRLEAMGAMGIARTFQFGGWKQRPMYDPTGAEWDTTIAHFYNKLFLLKDLMNTETGKRIAEKRHAFLESFLEQFYAEWEGREFE